MFNFFKKQELKGFKVCNNKQKNRKLGVAVESLQKLREKIVEKFNVENFDLYFNGIALINDDDYFSSIPNQSVITIVEDGDVLKTGERDPAEL